MNVLMECVHSSLRRVVGYEEGASCLHSTQEIKSTVQVTSRSNGISSREKTGLQTVVLIEN